eukprot:8800944-Ditylum_brightwellii.AAC.1
MSLSQGSAFYSHICIEYSNVTAITAKLHIIDLTAGTARHPSKMHLDLMGCNAPLPLYVGVEEDVYLRLTCCVGATGMVRVIN